MSSSRSHGACQTCDTVGSGEYDSGLADVGSRILASRNSGVPRFFISIFLPIEWLWGFPDVFFVFNDDKFCATSSPQTRPTMPHVTGMHQVGFIAALGTSLGHSNWNRDFRAVGCSVPDLHCPGIWRLFGRSSVASMLHCTSRRTTRRHGTAACGMAQQGALRPVWHTAPDHRPAQNGTAWRGEGLHATAWAVGHRRSHARPPPQRCLCIQA